MATLVVRRLWRWTGVFSQMEVIVNDRLIGLIGNNEEKHFVTDAGRKEIRVYPKGWSQRIKSLCPCEPVVVDIGDSDVVQLVCSLPHAFGSLFRDCADDCIPSVRLVQHRQGR